MDEQLGQATHFTATVTEVTTFLESAQKHTWAFFVERRLSRGPDEPTGVQMMVLQALSEHGTHSVSELSALLAVSAPTASRLVNTLVEHGWCQIGVSEHDHRRHDVNLTRMGQTVLSERLSKRLSRVRALLEQLTPSERGQLIHLMGRMVTLWRSTEGGSKNGG